MSDVMLVGILRMPRTPETLAKDMIDAIALIGRAQEAAARIEADAAEIERLTIENTRLRSHAVIDQITRNEALEEAATILEGDSPKPHCFDSNSYRSGYAWAVRRGAEFIRAAKSPASDVGKR